MTDIIYTIVLSFFGLFLLLAIVHMYRPIPYVTQCMSNMIHVFFLYVILFLVFYHVKCTCHKTTVLLFALVLLGLYVYYQRKEHLENLVPLYVPGTSYVQTGSPSFVPDTRNKKEFAPVGVSTLDQSELDYQHTMPKEVREGFRVEAHRPDNRELNQAYEDATSLPGMDFRMPTPGLYSTSGIAYSTHSA
jgi:hypothetical protein